MTGARLLPRAGRARRWRALSVFVLAVVAVALLSVAPAGLIPNSNRYDKLLHLLAYAGLMALGGVACRGWRVRAALAAGLVVYGLGLEAVQDGLPRHKASGFDVAANVAGLVLGMASLALLDRLGRRGRRDGAD